MSSEQADLDDAVVEHLVLDVTDGAGFEAAFAEAIQHVVGAKGCRGATLRRCVETKDRYLLLIEWDTIEDHTVGFRESPAFRDWRGLVGDFFTAPPEVEHFVAVTSDTV